MSETAPSPTDYPPHPPFGTVRLATEADVSRMAIVSVHGFKEAELFRYERPRFSEYRIDAMQSFATMFREQLQDPWTVVVVVEDERLPASVDVSAPRHLQRVVVGVATWVLPEHSPRVGQFLGPDLGPIANQWDRGCSWRRVDLFSQRLEAAESRWFPDMVICDKVVVHPAYRNRGHGRTLLRWGLELSDMDGVDQGVVSSHRGESLFLQHGFKRVGEVMVPEEGDAKGFVQGAFLYEAGTER